MLKKSNIGEVKSGGATLIHRFMSMEDVELLKLEIDRHINNQKLQNTVWVDEFKADHRIFGFENFSTIAKKFHRDINCHLAQLYGQEIESTVMAQRVDPVQNNMGSGGTWHRDSVRSQYKAFLYLVDITNRSGPLCLLPQSHKLSNKIRELLSIPKFMSIDIANPKFKPLKFKQILCNRGDVLFVDTSCIHRGTPSIQDIRYNCTVYAFRKGHFPPHIKRLIN